jgi:hypothetical protein
MITGTDTTHQRFAVYNKANQKNPNVALFVDIMADKGLYSVGDTVGVGK